MARQLKSLKVLYLRLFFSKKTLLFSLKTLLLPNTVALKLLCFILRGKLWYRIDLNCLPTALLRVFFRNLHMCFLVWSGKISEKQSLFHFPQLNHCSISPNCNHCFISPNWNRFRFNIYWLFLIYNGLCSILVEPHEIAFLVGQK